MNASVLDAISRINAAHQADPEQRELLYADRIETWVKRLRPDADAVLILAARCQHLERWLVPRSTYPMDKAGYHAWRKSHYIRQGDRAQELCLSAGISNEIATRVRSLVAKMLPRDPDGIALEDAACLVFLEFEAPGFIKAHPDYTAEQYLVILSKTARKMSRQGLSHASQLPLDEPLAGLLALAVSRLSPILSTPGQ